MTQTPRTAGAGALALMIAGLTAFVVLSSCSDVPARAATVNDTTISRSDFQRDLQALADNPGLLNLTGGTEISIDSETARGWLGNVITWKAAEQLLEDAGLEPTQAAIDDIRSQIADNEDAKRLPSGMQDEVVQGAASVQSLDQLPAPTAEELEAQYARGPAGTGVVCARHILVDTEAEAQAVLDELEAGADFAELAKQRSTEPAAQTTGGALGSSDTNGCLSVGSYQQNLDPDFTRGALAATVGVPTDPVKTQFGWHVILVRPFDEVKDDVAELVATSPGDAALSRYLANADIEVDPRYGRWDPSAGAVVSLR